VLELMASNCRPNSEKRRFLRQDEL
jgi:hypothetical protein